MRRNIYLTNATAHTFVHSIFDSGCYQCGFWLTENCHIHLNLSFLIFIVVLCILITSKFFSPTNAPFIKHINVKMYS